MNLRIKKIGNPGDLRSEYIELSASSSLNLKNYMLCDSLYTNSGKESKRHSFWFPELWINKGDTVRLNTGIGIHNLKLANLYWNLSEPVWNNPNSSAYLIKIDDYISYPDNGGFVDSLFSAA